MPITCDRQFEILDEQSFHTLNYEVMGLLFDIHNDLGRFCSENIYRTELKNRCERRGFATSIEVPIEVSFKDFRKTYYMDFLVNSSAMYELKALEALVQRHDAQALNYLLLTGMNHGMMVNMRPESVEKRFVSTRVTPAERYRFTIDEPDWKDLDGDSEWLRGLMVELLNDWGVFLDYVLFYDAINFFRGGESNVVKRIEIAFEDRVLGTLPTHLLNPEVAFKITAVTEDVPGCEEHLRKFLQLTELKAIQWINFNRHSMSFKTVEKSA
jgi:GxxExxY protein